MGDTGKLKTFYDDVLPNVRNSIAKIFTELNFLLKEDAGFKSRYISAITVGIVMIFVTIMFFLRTSQNNPDTFNDQFFLYGGILAVTLFILSTSYYFSTTGNFYYFAAILIICTIIYYIYQYYSNLSSNARLLFQNATYLFLIFGLIIFLAFLSIIFKSYLKTLPGWTGFFMNLIFYLPCLVVDLIEEVKKDVNSTTNTVFILFILEMVFLLIYFYFNYAIQKLYSYSNDGITLQEYPLYLNREKKLDYGKIYAYDEANYADMRPPTNNSGLSQSMLDNQSVDHKYRNNYTISLWLYLNSQQTNMKNGGYNIFDFARGGKPRLVYLNDGGLTDSNLDKIRINFSNTDNTDSTSYVFSIPKQKWNNIVVNYDRNIADLFLNGILIKSMDLSKHIPDSYATDTIIVGSNYNLNGAICNIQYYPNVLTQAAIVNMYNLLSKSNPPILS